MMNINRYSDLRVLVIGDIILDEYLMGDATKISQEAPVLVIKHRAFKYVLGGAGNVASNIYSLGANTFISGVVGDDKNSKILINLLKEKDINTSGLLIKTGRPTTIKTRVMVKDTQLVRYDNEVEDVISEEDSKNIITYAKKIKPDIILIADYDKGVVNKFLITELLKINKNIIINGKPENVNDYVGIDTLVCNKWEYNKMCELLKIDSYNELIESIKCKQIIKTKGKDGLEILTKNKEDIVAAHVVKEIDPSGASDTIVSVVALEKTITNIKLASELANYAASVVVQKSYTQPIYLNELLDYIEKTGELDEKDK